MSNDVSISPPFTDEDFEDFFHQSLSGFLITDFNGVITKYNARLAGWLGVDNDALTGKRFPDLLNMGGKIYYETHLWPLLRMQGFFDEVVLDLNANGQKLKVLINALDNGKKDEKLRSIHYTIVKAKARLDYEQNLQLARNIAEEELMSQKEAVLLREQLIAVLGHDLRNPLSAINMAVSMLQTANLGTIEKQLLASLHRSSFRMTELISNIMDFARTRLGSGIILNRRPVELQLVLEQLIQELTIVYSNRQIIKVFEIAGLIYCDPERIAQLFSNLLANALTHGLPDTPVTVTAIANNSSLEIAVSNTGYPIPVELQHKIFTPFTRQAGKASQNGLGLGLYIAAEIARAHNGTLTCYSTIEETRFTLYMPLNN